MIKKIFTQSLHLIQNSERSTKIPVHLLLLQYLNECLSNLDGILSLKIHSVSMSNSFGDIDFVSFEELYFCVISINIFLICIKISLFLINLYFPLINLNHLN